MTDDKNDNKILDKISHILLRKSSLNSPKTKNNNDIIEIAKGVSVVVSSENLRAFLLTKGVSNYYKPLSSDGREDFIKYAQKRSDGRFFYCKVSSCGICISKTVCTVS